VGQRLSDDTDPWLDRLLAGRPALRAALADLHDAAMDAVDKSLLAVCSARIAGMLGLEAGVDAGDPPRTGSPAERACLDLTEQFVLDVASVTDAQVAALVQHLGAEGAATFVNALLVVEQRLRMRAMWSHLDLLEAS
jgi:hypothetical protein